MPSGVYKRSKEQLDRLKKQGFKKGQKACCYWLGKKMPKKVREKMSKAQKGKHGYWLNKTLTKDHKIKIGKAGIGRLHSEKEKIKMSISQLGDKNHNWKGGITDENKKIRKDIRIKLWRDKVFKRDDYTCQKTKIKGGKLRPHHIKNFSEYPELRYEMSNGITLSEKSHREFHKKYGIKGNTQEQINEFLTTQN